MDPNRRSVLKLGVVDFGVEHASLPNGVEIDLAVIRHPGASAIVALDDDGQVAMIHQFRYAIGGYLWEIPAGVRNANETPLKCAHRELAEEAGLAATRWDHLGYIVTIPSFCDERIDLYLARELKFASGTKDIDEVISVKKIALPETMRMIREGEIVDAKTIAALYRTRDLIG